MKLKYSGWYVKDLRLCKYNDVKKGAYSNR